MTIKVKKQHFRKSKNEPFKVSYRLCINDTQIMKTGYWFKSEINQHPEDIECNKYEHYCIYWDFGFSKIYRGGYDDGTPLKFAIEFDIGWRTIRTPFWFTDKFCKGVNGIK